MNEPSLTADILMRYEQWYSALAGGDPVRARLLLTDDFSARLWDGQRADLAEVERGLASAFADRELPEVLIEQVTSDDSRLEILVRTRWRDSGDPVGVFEQATSVDTWAQGPHGWQLDKVELQRFPTAHATAELASPRLAALARMSDQEQSVAVAQFWREIDGHVPLTELQPDTPDQCLVTFVWRTNERSQRVTIKGSLPISDDHDCILERLAETDILYCSFLLPSAARGTYRFEVTNYAEERYPGSTTSCNDPLNARGFRQWWLTGSVFEVGGAPRQPYRPILTGTHRRLVAGLLHSQSLAEDRRYTVYLPTTLGNGAAPGGVIIQLDGEDTGSCPGALIPVPEILEDLVARRVIQPYMLVLVDRMSRRQRAADLRCNDQFISFLVDELVPALRERYRIPSDPDRVVVSGFSYGGLTAAYAGLTRSDVVGGVLSQSGSFWFGDGVMMDRFAESPLLNLRFYLEAGLLEGDLMIQTNRHLRSILDLKGYPIVYQEFAGGHEALSWRDTFADGLTALLR